MSALLPDESAEVKALRASELRYRRLFESARDGVLILDADTGMVVEVNPFLIQLLGLTHEDFLGKKVWELGFFKDIAANEAKFAELQAKDYVRYEDLPLETADGRKIEVEFVSNVYLVNGQRVIQCNIRDITARKRTERLAGDVLSTLNRPNNTKNIIRDILKLIKERTGIEAVGIRLKAGEDFPYYQTHGLPDDFVEMENHLCARDAAGHLLRDARGLPMLECMCGNVLCGRTDATLPFFTKGGSFWTNCATDLLASTTETERLACTLHRCHGAGYESVAMIPLRAGAETIGLLQLLDRRRNRFTTELITVLEWLGASVGVALTRMRAEDAVRVLSSRQEAILAAVPDIVMEVDVNKVYTWANRAGVEFFGADVVGKEAAFYFEGEQETLSNVQPLFTGDERVICVESWQRRKDGEKRLLAWWCRTLKDAQGTVIGILSTAHDITERKQAEKALQENTAFLNTLLEAMPAPVFYKDAEGRYTGINKAFEAFFGKTRAELLGKTVFDIAPRELAEVYHAKDRELFRNPGVQVYDTQMLDAQGLMHDVVYHKATFKGSGENVIGLIGVILDITERKRAEAALRESELFAQATVDALSSHLAVLDDAGTILAVNRAWRAFAEANPPLSSAVCVGANYLSVCDAAKGSDSAEAAAAAAGIRAILSGAQSEFALEYPCHSPETQRWFMCRARRFPGSGAIRVVVAHENITARKQVEMAFRESEERLRILFDNAGDSILLLEIVPDGAPVIRNANGATFRHLGYTRDELIGQPVSFIDETPGAAVLIAERRHDLRSGSGAIFELRHRCKDGSLRDVECSISELQIGTKTYFISVERDITERKQAAAVQARLAMAVDQTAEAIVITDSEGLVIYTNPAFEKITGYTRQDVYGHIWHFLQSGEHTAASYQKVWAVLRAGHVWSSHLIGKRKDGEPYEEEVTISPVLDAAGTIVNFVAVKRDVTREVALETQNRQIAKMDAVGQLAGGVAHDFNNKLQIILGSVEMALQVIPPAHPSRPDLLEIQEAARRSADLTRQLLAFSRQQSILPVLLDLNVAISGSLKMLSRVIGENIQLHFVPQADLGPVLMDPSQLDQVLVNLAVNARDAIAGVGSIVIEAANRTLAETDCADMPDFVAPGDYVALSFRDDGAGMTPEIQAHIFEPFYTTKKVGKGTGLGLATVYGIVKQNGGAIGVQSVPGQGATFTILLPRSSGAVLAAAEEAMERMPTGSETVLVTEDDEGILNLVQRTLVEQGYKVLTALLPRLALEVCTHYPEPIHLLLTDVIMPEMSGKELAERIRKLRPGVRLLYMSGYSAAIMEHQGQLGAGPRILQKPFSAAALAQHVRAALDRART